MPYALSITQAETLAYLLQAVEHGTDPFRSSEDPRHKQAEHPHGFERRENEPDAEDQWLFRAEPALTTQSELQRDLEGAA